MKKCQTILYSTQKIPNGLLWMSTGVIYMIYAKSKEFRGRMARNGYTGAGLAKEAGLSPGYITYILQKKRATTAPTAKKICTVLDCAFDDIFEIREEGER